jgi:hypothetical protein
MAASLRTQDGDVLLVATTRENVSPSLVLELLRRVGGIIKARAAGTAACGRLGARERRAIRTRKRAQRGGAVRSCLGACERRAPRARRGACTGVQDCGAMCCPACEAAQLVRLSLGCSALTQPGASDALPGRQAHSKQQGEPCARLRRVVPMRRRSRASSLCRSSSRTGLPGSGRGGTVYAIQRACPEPCQVALRGLPREGRPRGAAARQDYCGLLSEEAVRKNGVLLYEVLDEVIDYGFPQNSSSAALREFVLNEPTVLHSAAR